MTVEQFIKFLQQGRNNRTTEQIIREVTQEQIIFTKKMDAMRKSEREKFEVKGA